MPARPELLPEARASTESRLTSVGVIQEDKLVPVVVVQQGEQRPADGRPQLQGELALALGGEAGRDEGDVQGAAEGRQRVDRALVVQAEDGEDAAGVLGADWRERGEENTATKVRTHKGESQRASAFSSCAQKWEAGTRVCGKITDAMWEQDAHVNFSPVATHGIARKKNMMYSGDQKSFLCNTKINKCKNMNIYKT